MADSTTVLYNPTNPSEDAKRFTFDFSYWSHDGFKENNKPTNGGGSATGAGATANHQQASSTVYIGDASHQNGHQYADQERVYNDLGKSLLENSFDGYNAALFAYGQTGSGKSYSIIGYGANKGIVPRFCEELFETIRHRRNEGQTHFEVKVAMLEIYNEIVRDLLDPGEAASLGAGGGGGGSQQLSDASGSNSDSTSQNKKGPIKRRRGLRVREHPSKGFYAEGLKYQLVNSKKEILAKIDEGTINRSIAATNMNETSSRAHTIVIISLTQKNKNDQGVESAKTSLVNLVDLAGSERLNSTQASGDRLKEGVSINQSLACLGNCIHALAEKAGGKNVRVPFRESVLTRLLMNALGGNSKCVMIAAISPADINYDETLSTLRYADRAKQIKTHAKINSSQTDKIIQQLREENEKLKKMMESNAPPPLAPSVLDNHPNEDINELRKKWEEEMKAAMIENERIVKELKANYEEKLKRKDVDVSMSSSSMSSINSEPDPKLNNPHLSNLNFDEQLSGRIIHIIKMGTNTIGKSDSCDITLYGPRILETHASLFRKENGIILLEREGEEARILLNGDPLTSRVSLSHNDRLLFGTTQLFVFKHPEQEQKSLNTFSEVTFELAQEEIAAKAGYAIDHQDQTMEVAILNKDLMEILPAIDMANAISEDLDQNTRFEVMLVAPQILGKNSDRTEVYVKVVNVELGVEFEWPKEKFLLRLYTMRDMFQNYQCGEDWQVPPEKNPFIDDPSAESLIGSAQLFLQPLAYLVEIKEQLELVDYRRNEVGIVNAEVVICNENGVEFSEHDDIFVDSPQELIGKDLRFMFKIHGCRGLPARFTDVRCKYRIFLDKEDTTTESISDTSNPDFNHSKIFHFHPVTQPLVDYLKDGSVTISVWGKQIPRRPLTKMAASRIGKGINGLQEELMATTNNLMDGFKMNGRVIEPSQQSVVVELLLLKKQQARQQQRIENLRKLVESAERGNMLHIPTKLVKDLLSTTTQDVADSILASVTSVSSAPAYHHESSGPADSSGASARTGPSSASKAVATRLSSISAFVMHSMESKSGSVTRALTKKAGRAKERLLQNFGKADKTTDELFEVYHNNFNKQHSTALRLQKELKNYVTCLRALETANKNLMDCLTEIYEPEWPGHDQIPVKSQALQIYYEDLCHKLNDQVTIPLSTYLSQFSEIKAKIAKRGRKLVDYDGTRHTVESLENKAGKKDEIKIAKSREQMEEARRLYEVLNRELHDELPALYDSRIPFLISTLQTFFAAETRFHSENSKIHAQLSDLIDSLAVEAQKGAYNSGINQRQLTPAAVLSSIKHSYSDSGANGEKKGDVSSPTSPERKRPAGEGQEIPAGATTTDLPPGVLYRVRATYKYQAEDQDELNFEGGEIIRVIEYEDPEEQEEGWLLGVKESTGEKGLFPANFTRPI